MLYNLLIINLFIPLIYFNHTLFKQLLFFDELRKFLNLAQVTQNQQTSLEVYLDGFNLVADSDKLEESLFILFRANPYRKIYQNEAFYFVKPYLKNASHPKSVCAFPLSICLIW